jgi:hypothetical protein
MGKVLGIGRLFFRSRDPQALAAWYATHLGATPVPSNYEDPGWRQQGGPTAFAPFPANSRYFGDTASWHPQQWMVNFRVANLDVMLAQLRAANIETTPKATLSNYGSPPAATRSSSLITRGQCTGPINRALFCLRSSSCQSRRSVLE